MPESRTAHKDSAGRAQGRLIVIIGPRSGVGCTTIAAGVAAALCRLAEGEVVLLDADRESPGLTAFLGSGGDPGWETLYTRRGVLRADRLPGALRLQSSGVWTLTASAPSSKPASLPDTASSQVVQLLRRRFSWVVVDLGVPEGEAAFSMLRSADFIVLVVTPDLPLMRPAKDLLNGLEERDIPAGTVWPVLNRAGAPGGLRPGDVEVWLIRELRYLVEGDAAPGLHVPGKPGYAVSPSGSSAALAELLLSEAQRLPSAEGVAPETGEQLLLPAMVAIHLTPDEQEAGTATQPLEGADAESPRATPTVEPAAMPHAELDAVPSGSATQDSTVRAEAVGVALDALQSAREAFVMAQRSAALQGGSPETLTQLFRAEAGLAFAMRLADAAEAHSHGAGVVHDADLPPPMVVRAGIASRSGESAFPTGSASAIESRLDSDAPSRLGLRAQEPVEVARAAVGIPLPPPPPQSRIALLARPRGLWRRSAPLALVAALAVVAGTLWLALRWQPGRPAVLGVQAGSASATVIAAPAGAGQIGTPVETVLTGEPVTEQPMGFAAGSGEATSSPMPVPPAAEGEGTSIVRATAAEGGATHATTASPRAAVAATPRPAQASTRPAAPLTFEAAPSASTARPPAAAALPTASPTARAGSPTPPPTASSTPRPASPTTLPTASATARPASPTPTPTGSPTARPATPTPPLSVPSTDRPAPPTPQRAAPAASATRLPAAPPLLVAPEAGAEATGEVAFRWQPQAPLPPGAAYEVVWWNAGSDPALAQGIAPPTTGDTLAANVDFLVKAGKLTSRNMAWTVLIVRPDPYERLTTPSADVARLLQVGP